MADPSNPSASPPDSSGFGAAMSRFGQGVMNFWGGDLGNVTPGGRDARAQIVDTQRKQAETQDLSAHAEHQRMVNASMKRQAEIMQRLAQQKAQAVSGAEGQVQQFLAIGDAMVKGGEPAAGAEYITKAAHLEQVLAGVRRQEDQRKNQEFGRAMEMTEKQDSLWAGVHDQATQDAAALQWSALPESAGKQNPFAGIYDEASVKARQETTKEGLAWAKAKRESEAAEDLHKVRERGLKFVDVREEYTKSMEEHYKKQDERAAKGGAIKYPPVPLLGSAEDKIAARFPDLPTNEVRVAAREIASRAMKIAASTHTDQEDALKQALNERRNDFKTLNETYKIFGVIPTPFTESETHYRPDTRGEIKDAKPLVNDKGWKLMEDAKGNRAYVSPSGREFDLGGVQEEESDSDVESDEPAEDWAARQGR